MDFTYLKVESEIVFRDTDKPLKKDLSNPTGWRSGIALHFSSGDIDSNLDRDNASPY